METSWGEIKRNWTPTTPTKTISFWARLCVHLPKRQIVCCVILCPSWCRATKGPRALVWEDKRDAAAKATNINYTKTLDMIRLQRCALYFEGGHSLLYIRVCTDNNIVPLPSCLNSLGGRLPATS